MRVKTNIASFFTFLMAALLLVSTINYAVDAHYCQGNLKSIGIFGKAKNCHEIANSKASCPHHQSKVGDEKEGCNEGMKDCCQNNIVVVESDINQYIIQVLASSFDGETLLVLGPVSSISDILVIDREQVLDKLYKPPLINKDVQVLFESFLI